jgi:uncharacterized membrane protein YkvA (DUF1232 family)
MNPAIFVSSLAASAFLGWLVGQSESRGQTASQAARTEPVEQKVARADNEFEKFLGEFVQERHKDPNWIFEGKNSVASKAAGLAVVNVPGLIDSVALWRALRDPTSTWVTKGIIAAVLLYIVSPIDAIPDELPLIGVVDDAMIVEATMKAIAASIHPRHYREAKEWFEEQGIDIPYYEPVVDRIGKMAQEPEP